MLCISSYGLLYYSRTLSLYLCVADDERCVSRHKEVTPGRRYEGSNKPDEVVVHVARIPQGGGGRSHDGADDRVELPNSRVRDTEPVHLRWQCRTEEGAGVR